MKIPFSVYDFFGYLASGFALLAVYDYMTGARWLLAESAPFGLTSAAILASYVLGHAVAHLSSILIEHGLVRRVLGSPESNLLASTPPATRWRWLFPGMFSPLPGPTRERVLAYASVVGITSDSRALFLHCHQRTKSDEPTRVRLDTFLTLYGFCRNLSMATTLSAVTLIGCGLMQTSWPLPHEAQSMLLAGALCAAVAYVLLLRYLKFFRHYTQEVLVYCAELEMR